MRPAHRSSTAQRHFPARNPVANSEIAALALPAGEGYAWCAGEAAAMARVRDLLIAAKAHPRDAMRVAAYWKRGASDPHDDLAR